MKIIKASTEIMNSQNELDCILNKIELAARICYKSEGNMNKDSSIKMVKNLIANKHEAMLEHAYITVKFICDRGISHELVRHRIASFAQESTRYCNYSKDKFGNEITVIKPYFLNEYTEAYQFWKNSCLTAEKNYFNLLELGFTPQEARCVLPNSLKTEVVVTMNIREWRHFFNLRASGKTGKPHPQMLELTIPLLNELKNRVPVVFDDIKPEFKIGLDLGE